MNTWASTQDPLKKTANSTRSPNIPQGMEDRLQSEAQINLRALMAAWQRVLPEFFPAMAQDTVTGAPCCAVPWYKRGGLP